ncbi:HAMP domain-containing histidine kinase [Methylosinus sp. H3A]|uniref:sensor histidine kinase n=1 Tax=Methylosinus sp. H3A TaxID=2785786 RepID=UPI0018C3361E|nr:HAMP domain-containing sensor histidine kinase [Methylosinus sp. H3A]MBG0812442.1 HAMP domain-containing histidine kinase [Methylosinus sp. H3A]
MRRRRSLTLRLVAYLSLAQFLAAFGPWFVVAFLTSTLHVDNDAALEHYTFLRIRDLVVDSIVPAPDGGSRIEPTPTLRARLVENPALRFAAAPREGSGVMEGSAPELLPRLALARDNGMRQMRFLSSAGSEPAHWGMVELSTTPDKKIFVAAQGFEFRWPDLFHFVIEDRLFGAVVFAVGWGLSALLIFIGVRRALIPLRRATTQAARIDLDSLGQAIDDSDMPEEVRPIISAMNGALARLDASVTRMRRFTANAAHELRTPVAVMRARLENSEEPSFKLDLMRDATRIQAIIEQLLINARIEEKHVSTDQSVDLVDVVSQVVADHTPLALRLDRRIEFDCDADHVLVLGDRRAIECVVANLLDNALRAEPRGGTVLVRVDVDAEVSVIDHGDGVPLEDRETIFEPFCRRTETTPGSGLGLAIARELMEKLRGHIFVDDTPGGGAIFKLSFPATFAERRRSSGTVRVLTSA